MIGWIDMVVSLLEVAGFSLHDFGGFAEGFAHAVVVTFPNSRRFGEFHDEKHVSRYLSSHGRSNRGR
jgi:hypothetical protein